MPEALKSCKAWHVSANNGRKNLIRRYKLIWKRQSKIHDCLNVRLKLYVLLLSRVEHESMVHLKIMHSFCKTTSSFHFQDDVCTQIFIFPTKQQLNISRLFCIDAFVFIETEFFRDNVRINSSDESESLKQEWLQEKKKKSATEGKSDLGHV